MKRNRINCIFAVCILLGLLCGLGRTLLCPKTVNYYENRYADRAAPLTAAGVLDGSFQDSMEDALSDQIPGAQKLKKLYHLTFSAYQKVLTDALATRLPDRFINIGTLQLYHGYLCFYPRYLCEKQAGFDKKIENYNALFAAHPETEFYLYYIEKETDLSFGTGERTMTGYEYLTERLNLPAERTGCFRIGSFADYSERFRRTDHHWNDYGAYCGYRDILAMLAPGETSLQRGEEMNLGAYSGSKAAGRALKAFSEPFYAAGYAFPAMTVGVNGVPVQDYGARDAFLSGTAEIRVSYGSFYGTDEGLVTFDTGAAEKENVLILGDSFDNAILKPIASHFGRTYAVDLRFYHVHTGKDFRLAEFLEENDISKVVLIGNCDCFSSADFLVED